MAGNNHTKHDARAAGRQEETIMSKTVVGLFDDFQDAQNVVRELVDAGFGREHISLAANQTASGYTGDSSDFDNNSAGTAGEHAVGMDAGIGAGVGGVVGLLAGLGLLLVPGVGPVLAVGPIVAALGATVGSTVVGAGIGAVAGGLIGGLTHIGVPKEHAEYYAEGIRRGGTLVTVDAPDDKAQSVVDILNGYGAVDIDTRGASYRAGGYTGYDESASPYSAEDITRERGTSRTLPAMPTNASASGETVIPVVEEELSVGKRQVRSGGARIHTYVTERPVEETVTLREERVTVDRRPVDRAVTDADKAFGEKSIEVTETAEVPVVSKTARVVEEVVVGKTATERTETVRDTIRRTDVEVEDLTKTGTVGDPRSNI